jgi:HlyD family secretion protein
MKWLKIGLTILALVLIVALGASCKGSTAATTTTASIPSTVQKGTISISVTGTGNLALSTIQDLHFATAGTMNEVLVDAGDTVTQGQELAKLDTSDLDDQIAALTKALSTAQRNLANQQANLDKANRQVLTKQFSISQAELDVQSAQNNLANISEVKTAQEAVDTAESNLKFAQQNLQASTMDTSSSPEYWRQQVTLYTASLAEAQKDLQDTLQGTSTSLSDNVALQVSKATLAVEQSQRNLEDARQAVEDAKTAVKNTQLDVADAQSAVTEAQANLDDAKALSTIITAPFDGFITKVNVQGGDTVQKGTVALQIADPNKFEANIMVTEQDIFSVKIGGEATVSLDALSGLSFPAKITKIAPTATVSQGVVNYKVTVELTSTKPTLAGFSGAGQNFPQITKGGSLPTNLPSNLPTNLPRGTSVPTNIPSFSPGATPSGSGEVFQGAFGGNPPTGSLMQNLTLKEGLSATVDIIVQKKENVLVVPSRAITRQGKDFTVQLTTGETTETRVVKTGMEDSTNTEITEGLNEGDKVMITVSSGSSSSTQRQSNTGFPGGGEFRMVVPR